MIHLLSLLVVMMMFRTFLQKYGHRKVTVPRLLTNAEAANAAFNLSTPEPNVEIVETGVVGCESLKPRYWLPAFDSKALVARAETGGNAGAEFREAVEAARISRQGPAGKRMSEKTKVILGVILFPPFVWYVTRRGIGDEMFIGLLIWGSVWVGAVISLAAGAFDNR